MKRISTCNVPEDENNLVQRTLGGEFWTGVVIMHKAYYFKSGLQYHPLRNVRLVSPGRYSGETRPAHAMDCSITTDFFVK